MRDQPTENSCRFSALRNAYTQASGSCQITQVRLLPTGTLPDKFNTLNLHGILPEEREHPGMTARLPDSRLESNCQPDRAYSLSAAKEQPTASDSRPLPPPTTTMGPPTTTSTPTTPPRRRPAKSTTETRTPPPPTTPKGTK